MGKFLVRFVDEHCDMCFKFCEFYQTPCLDCAEVRFCSEACKTEAMSKHHRYECRTSKYFEDFLSKVNPMPDSEGFILESAN